ncbi:MAG: hypothetical protein P8Z42_07590 [Anaerolineales bacterium]
MLLALEHTIPSPGKHLCGLAWDGRHLWHSDGDTHTIYQLDPNSGRIDRKLACPDVRTSLCCESGFLWQIAGILAAVDIHSGEEIARFELPGPPTDMCFDGERIWFNHFPAQEICAVRLPET